MKTQKIKTWYKKEYRKDKDTIEMMSNTPTFENIYNEPWRVYELLDVDESDVREKVFAKTAEVYEVEYEVIYYKWLNKN
jgi:hypothetical protein